MLYVEENLQCYGHERSTNSDDNYMNLIDCDPKNVPLISPQSTLSDTLLKPPGLTVPTEKMNLFDNVQKNERNIKTNPFYDENKIGDDMLLNGKKSITNPFLQDEFKYDKYANILSPHMFMQMYEKNLKIQMQIAAAINILLTKIKMLPLENTNDILSTSEQLTPKINLQGNINSNDNTVPCNTFLPKERATINNNFVDLNSNGVNWNSFSPTTNNASIHNGENIDQDNSFTHLLANEHNMNYNKVNNFDDFKVSSLCNEINNKSVLPSNNTVQKDLNLCNSISLNTTIPCNTSDAYVFNNGESDFSEVIPETILPVFNKNVINDAHQSITINEVDHQFCQFEQESKKNELNTYKETNPFKALIQDESRTFEFFDSPKKQILPEKLISSTEVINNYSKSESSNFKHPIEYVHIFENMNEQSNNIKDINESISRITFKSSSDKKKNKVEHWKEDKLFTKVADFHAFCSHKLEENENEKSMVSIPHKYTNEMLLNGTNNLGTITDSRDTFNAVNSSPWPINNSNSMVSLNSNNSILKPSSLINFDLSSVINNSNPDDKKYLLCRSISETSQTSQSFSRLFNDTDNTQLEVDKKNNSRSISAEEWLNSVKASFASETQFTQMDNPIISNSSQIKNGDQKFISLSELFKKNLDSCEQSLKNETTLQNYFLKEFKCDKSQSNHKDIDIEYKGCSNNITETGENIASYSYKIGSTLNDLKLENQENETMEQIVKIQSKIEADSEQIITHKQIPYHTVSKDITSQILFAYPVELTKKVVFVFHFEDEGWLSTEEFVNVFTNYETLLQYLETLSIHNIDVSFKEIVRSENSDIFNHIDRILSTTPRNEDKKINKIHLMPLKSIIIVLAKLRIIELEDLDNAVTKKELIQGSFIYEAWKLIRSYGILLQLIKEKLKNI